MFSCLCALLAASALAQQPPEAAWLKAVPGDVDVVVRCRGIDASKKDLMAMLQAMSPTLARQAGPALEQAVGQARDDFGAAGTETPILFTAEFHEGGGGMPSMVYLVASEDYASTLKALAGPDGKPDPKPQDEGYDSIVDSDGITLYTLKGDGYLAFVPRSFGFDDNLLKAMAHPEGKTLDARLSPELRAQFLGGDLGLYANLAGLQVKYADQIASARQQLMAAFDQAGAQMQNGQMEQAKKLYGKLFDALKSGDSLALHLDLDPKGLALSGLVSVKPGSDASKALQTARTGDASLLGKLPPDMLAYVYLNIDPEMIEYFQSMNFGAMDPDFKDKPEYKAALENLRAVGHQETFGAINVFGGMDGITLARPEHPEKVLEGTKQMLQAVKSSKFVKDIDITPKAETYKGIDFTRSAVTFDLDKLVEHQGGNPASEAMMKSMFPDGKLTTWTGLKDGLTYSVIGSSWDDAKKKLDVALSGSGGVGKTEGFQAVRSQLPDKFSGAVLFQSQTVVRMVANVLSSMGGAEIKPPADLPETPVFFGGSLSTSPAGYRIDFVVPSANGPVFEKGLVPVVQSMKGKVSQ